ncbi:Peptidoglycan/LPS O-acetylase OafA/YrhL, contains acyltransferase and SGNH-hydrolase domains [Nocardiopsis flavescens]|uniref:Peptidoglycan/LPS O-acetylase OafA/YrhL, contains acyltransferase and SGNH-hydrolase domains n=1 Tax=Nocardiopsis flavescens TaxID=758803 RepID=A0A1M6V4W9_9ACTN|nr:acyltransferase family protein [Nocardiopsis flavescens]SHK76528.1 Peptidoglycan/LPS O-acetylase OafA/YrhL, contains acyltransferase and SGNH-hydrolase domains [Nocardiopsis flavescens]
MPSPTAPEETGRARPVEVGTGGHRPGIDGLRAVAVLLVAAYHIWLGRVSGGVDVFLMLTGLLVTSSLLRAATGGGIRYGAFLARLAARLLPTAALVVLFTLAGTWLFLPQTQWREAPGGAVAALLGHTNWRLALDSVDYLARDGVPDPFQHFWSLAVQWQFYLVWPALVAGAVLLARRAGRDPRRPLLWVLAAVFALSLAYSVVVTRVNQPWAYFDTGARVWEPALGGLVALLLPLLNPGRRTRLALGWAGLAALVLCGVLLQVSTAFPGFAALWPTLAAAAVIAAASPAGGAVGADRLLSSRPLRYLGSISYALYLWHWPVLVFYLAATGRELATPQGGAAVLAVSVLAAAATTPLADRLAARGRGAGRRAVLRGTAVAVAFLLPTLGAAGAWAGVQNAERARWDALLADGTSYPGAAVSDGAAAAPGTPVYPPVSLAAEDAPATYADGCNQTTMDSEVLVCEYGSPDPERTVALVGGSHAAHWFPALDVIAVENDWRLVNIVKGACLFTDAPQVYKGESYTSCAEWNRGVMEELERLRPDTVFTTGTTTSLDASAGFGEEQVVDGYTDRWRELGEWGIEVVAVRDTPRFGFDVPGCLAGADPADTGACTTGPERSLAPVSPLEEAALPANVTALDLTDLFCEPDVCRPVIGNVLVYWDASHIGATFMRTLAPELERRWTLAERR